MGSGPEVSEADKGVVWVAGVTKEDLGEPPKAFMRRRCCSLISILMARLTRASQVWGRSWVGHRLLCPPTAHSRTCRREHRRSSQKRLRGFGNRWRNPKQTCAPGACVVAHEQPHARVWNKDPSHFGRKILEVIEGKRREGKVVGCNSKMREHWDRKERHVPGSPAYFSGGGSLGSWAGGGDGVEVGGIAAED